jgi:hypothetical protein
MVRIMDKRSTRIKAGLAALVLIGLGTIGICAWRWTRNELKAFDLRSDRLLRVEIYEQDHCCGGPKTAEVTLSPALHAELLRAIKHIDSSSKDWACKCETNGTQVVLHMSGAPELLQLTRTGCGDFVVHDGQGHIFLYFMNRTLVDFLQREYWSKKPDVDHAAEQPVSSNGP